MNDDDASDKDAAVKPGTATMDGDALLALIRSRADDADAEDEDDADEDEVDGFADFRAGKEDFHTALKRKHNSTRTLRSLTADEQKRSTALEDILSKLRQGKHVQNRRLQIWLTDEQFAMLTDEWQSQQALRDEVKQKPDEIVDYEERLRKATLFYNRAEYYSRKGNRAQVKQFESAYTRELEALIERYAEILHRDPSMTVWFDRQLNFEAGGDATADLASIPRIVTSKSIEAHSGGGILSGKQKKREVKIAIVEHAIDRLRYE